MILEPSAACSSTSELRDSHLDSERERLYRELVSCVGVAQTVSKESSRRDSGDRTRMLPPSSGGSTESLGVVESMLTARPNLLFPSTASPWDIQTSPLLLHSTTVTLVALLCLAWRDQLTGG